MSTNTADLAHAGAVARLINPASLRRMISFTSRSFSVLCLVAALFAPVLASESISHRCAAYRALLERLDCPESFAAIDSFLNTNRATVSELFSGSYEDRDSMVDYRDALERTSRTIQDCLVKHTTHNDDPRMKALIQARVRFTTYFAGIDYWTRNSNPYEGVTAILLRQHDKAAEAVSEVASLW